DLVTGVQTCALPISQSMAGMRGLRAYLFRAFGFSKQASSHEWSVVDGDLWTGGFYRAALRFISDGYAHFHRWFDKEPTGNHAHRSEERRVGKECRSR